MPRINIEDKLFADFRFLKFSTKVGCSYKALGMAIMIWRTAQKFWVPDEGPIPISIYKKMEGSKLFEECGLSVRQRKGQYIHGSREQFEWLFQIRDASRKALESRRKNSPPGDRPVTARSPSYSYSYSNQIQKKNTPPFPPGGKNTGGVLGLNNAQKLQEIWNKNRGQMSECTALQSERLSAINRALIETPNLGVWEKIIKKMAAAPLLCGKANPKWRAGFDWMLKPGNASRVLEGEFDDASEIRRQKEKDDLRAWAVHQENKGSNP